MHVDCDTCSVRGAACSGCVITMLLGAPPEGVHWDAAERQAMTTLADSGLVRPLLHVVSANDEPGSRSAAQRPGKWEATGS